MTAQRGVLALPLIAFLTLAANPLPAADGNRVAEARAIRQTAEEILSAPEFRHLRSLQTSKSDTTEPDTPVDDSNAENDWMPRFSVSPIGNFLGAVIQIFAWLAMTAACGLIVYLIIQAIAGRSRAGDRERQPDHHIEGEGVPDQSPADLPADVYLARAREWAAQGRYGEAVSQLLLGAMSQIERSGLIRFRRGATYRDYLRAVQGRPGPLAGLRSIVRIYEPVGFGRRTATRDQFDFSLNAYEAEFGAAISPMEN